MNDKPVSPADAIKEMGGALAKQIAQLVAPYSPEVQMMASQIFVEAMIVVHVKPSKRVEFAGKLSRDMIAHLRDHGRRK